MLYSSNPRLWINTDAKCCREVGNHHPQPSCRWENSVVPCGSCPTWGGIQTYETNIPRAEHSKGVECFAFHQKEGYNVVFPWIAQFFLTIDIYMCGGLKHHIFWEEWTSIIYMHPIRFHGIPWDSSYAALGLPYATPWPLISSPALSELTSVFGALPLVLTVDVVVWLDCRSKKTSVISACWIMLINISDTK